MNVSCETDADGRYADLVLQWNDKIKLVGPAFDRLAIRREISECRGLGAFVDGPVVADFGSGSGLPVVPMALARPGCEFIAIEADRRKVAFLNAARRHLQLDNLKVISNRIEDLPPIDANEITARAFAPLDRIIDLSLRHLAPSGRLVLLKGARVGSEIETALRHFRFDHTITDLPDARGCVLTVAGIEART